MTRDETLTAEEVEGKNKLKKEAEECAEKFFGKPTDLVDLDNLRIFKNAYFASAEPREKQIQIDAEQIRALQKQNGELTDKVNDLEDKLANADYQLEGRDNEIRELTEKVEKMKCCGNCDNTWNGYHLDVCDDCKNHNKWKLKEIKEK